MTAAGHEGLAKSVVWDADLGGAVLATEAFGGRIFAGADNGYVQCFEAGGNRTWSRFLAEPVMGLAPDDSEGCLVALRDGTVLALDGLGEILASGKRGSEATTAAWTSCPEGKCW